MSEDRDFLTPPWASGSNVVGHGIGQLPRPAGSVNLNGPTPPLSAAPATLTPLDSPGEPPRMPTASLGQTREQVGQGSWVSSGSQWREESGGFRGADVPGPVAAAAVAKEGDLGADEEAAETEEPVVGDLWIKIRSSDPVPGFSEPASDCINRAGWIAFMLNNTCVGTAHLLMALSLDERAAPGMKARDLDVKELRRAALPVLIRTQWKYSNGSEAPPPEFNTTSELADILEAAKRRAGERDNQPATLPDLLDVLKIMHERGQLIPASKDTSKIEVREDMLQVKTKLDELKTLVDQGFRWSVARLDQAMAEATCELLDKLTPPPSSQGNGGGAHQGRGWSLWRKDG